MAEEQQIALLGRALKEGERILAPTRRPDGTLRKPIRIRAGYVPQDEVAIYQSKGALLRKGTPELPPGYDPVLDAKPKTKSAKRNERKKEKKHQAALASAVSDKGKDLDPKMVTEMDSAEDMAQRSHKDVQSVALQMNMLALSGTPSGVGPAPDPTIESPNPGSPAPDIDRRIRALKKKIRLTEAQQKGERDDPKLEHLEKEAKLEGWRKELKLLEEIKAAAAPVCS